VFCESLIRFLFNILNILSFLRLYRTFILNRLFHSSGRFELSLENVVSVGANERDMDLFYIVVSFYKKKSRKFTALFYIHGIPGKCEKSRNSRLP
jgi:hypothetical protein